MFKLIAGNVPTIYASGNHENIVNYSDEEIFEYMDNFYKSELIKRPNDYAINKKKFNLDVFEKMACIEPFCDYLDLLQIYFDEEVSINEWLYD